MERLLPPLTQVFVLCFFSFCSSRVAQSRWFFCLTVNQLNKKSSTSFKYLSVSSYIGACPENCISLNVALGINEAISCPSFGGFKPSYFPLITSVGAVMPGKYFLKSKFVMALLAAANCSGVKSVSKTSRWCCIISVL